MRIVLRMGDYYNDGHGIHDTVTVESSHPPQDIEAAYKAAVEKTGIDWVNDVADEYQDDVVHGYYVEKLAKHGITVVGDVDPDDDDGSMGQNCEHFAANYIAFVKLGNPDIEMVIVPNDALTIDIGGYGLFYN